MSHNSYWNMKNKIPEVIVYCVVSDQAFNDDDGDIYYFDTEEEFEEWRDIQMESQVYTGFNIYSVFRRK